ncbi:MAG: hypothetical protein MPJ50_04255 [Pirellulales bacterium]|nr:hypothetical protein [Pirellulales bacterium]
MTHSKRGHTGLAVLLLVWGIAILAGTFYLMDYSGTPGTRGDAVEQWPTETTLERGPNEISIVMFVHPQCPCTHSTLETLNRILAHTVADDVGLYFVFRIPPGRNVVWARSSLWQKARALPNAKIYFDMDGTETERFGARTSGYIVAYDQSGHLRFCGGITPARNHEGSSIGGDALAEVISGKCHGETMMSAVFGCPLFGPDEVCHESAQCDK